MDAILKNVDLGSSDPEFENFLSRVDEISKIMEGLSSEDSKEQEKALRKADILLCDKGNRGDLDEESTKVTSDRTLINKSVTSDPSECAAGDAAGQVGFMKMVEKDAAERARDRRNRKEKSDEFRGQGNDAFKRRAYAEALNNYNKAIELVKDSPCLYTNRALTWIRIGIPSMAIDDLNMTLDLNPKSLKARLLKARALFNLSQPELCRKWLLETKELYPENLPMIKRYEDDLFDLTMELNMAYNEGDDKKRKTKKDSGPPTLEEKKAHYREITEPEVTWLKAARGQIHDIEEELPWKTT